MARGAKRFFGDPTPIQKDYLAADLIEDARDFELVGSTHIQVGVDEEDAVKETRWLQSISEIGPNLPTAIVAFADLRCDDLEEQISLHQQSKRFRGIRQIIGRHPAEDRKTGSSLLIGDPNFVRGLKLLERLELSFDLQLIESQYGTTQRMFEALPKLSIAICHFASPWDLSKDGFKRWRLAMKPFSDMPNVCMKFSGFGMFRPDWTVDDIKPFIETALELFGPKRCMAGSNFPVDKLYGGYDRIWLALNELIGNQSDLGNVTCETGAQFYGAELPAR